MSVVTIELYAGSDPKGAEVREEVRTTPLGDSLFKVMQSPGLVQGVAAGDVISLESKDQSRFHVKERGGNLCVQVFCNAVNDQIHENFNSHIVGIGGWMDGCSHKELVFTIPVSVGFGVIEEVLNSLVGSCQGCEWYYGNVYDPIDGITPLNWWDSKEK